MINFILSFSIFVVVVVVVVVVVDILIVIDMILIFYILIVSLHDEICFKTILRKKNIS
jgi:Flp pilus assembly protein TadB